MNLYISNRYCFLLKEYLLFIFIFFNCLSTSNAQTFFQKHYNHSSDDKVWEAILSDSAFVYMAGQTQTPGSTAVRGAYIAKFDTLGNPLWAKVYQGFANGAFQTIAENKKKNILASGSIDLDNNGWQDGFVLEINYDGTIVKQNIFLDTLHFQINKIACAKDDGYYLAGYKDFFPGSGKRGFVMKIDSLLNPVWIIQNNTINEFTDLFVHDNNEFYAVGYSDQNTSGWINSHLVKIDSLGNQIWQKILAEFQYQIPYVIRKTVAGNLIVLTHTLFNNQQINDLISEFDTSGNLIWAQSYQNSQTHYGVDVIAINDGSGYLIQQSNGNLYKIDLSGNLLWMNRIVPGSSTLLSNCMLLPSDNLLVAGFLYSNSNLYLGLYDSVGNGGCNLYNLNYVQATYSLNFINDSTQFTYSNVNPSSGVYSFPIQFIPATLCSTSTGNVELEINKSINIEVFPTPFSDHLNLSMPQNLQNSHCRVIIYDLFGKKLFYSEYSQLIEEHILDLSHLKSGMFILEFLDSENNSMKIKIIKS